MYLFDRKEECCGCGACAAVCPVGAIVLESDGRFDYPSVNADMCIDCGSCVSVCSFKGEKNREPNVKAAYAVKADAAVRILSSSGGMFTLISDSILSGGGVVYGAAYGNGMRVEHKKAENPCERDKMRGSKYVRSDMTGVYAGIKKDLADGKKVLFTGTPCQVAAVKNVIGDNGALYTADLICHGPASPEVWGKYIAFLEDTYGKRVVDFSFRNKEVSWREYSPKVTFEDGTVIGATDITGSFTEVFRYELCLAPSCTECRFASPHREGDITVGDFWGIENCMPEKDDGAGVSAVIVNTKKGAELFECVKMNASVYECLPDMIYAGQVNMEKSSVISDESENFYRLCDEGGIKKALAEYTRVGVKRRAKDAVKRFLGR